MKLFDSIRRSSEKRAAYHRTLRELRALPLEVTIDLDIDSGNLEHVAHQAVYGA